MTLEECVEAIAQAIIRQEGGDNPKSVHAQMVVRLGLHNPGIWSGPGSVERCLCGCRRKGARGPGGSRMPKAWKVCAGRCAWTYPVASHCAS